MITAKDLYVFFLNKDNYNIFKEYNPKIGMTYKQMFRDYNYKKLKDLTHQDFLTWIDRVSEYINPSVMIDFYEKFSN